MEPEELRAARTVLSVPTSHDIDEIHEACQDAAIQRFTVVPSPYLREHAEGFVVQCVENWHSGVEATWTIRSDERVAGMISLNRIPSGAPEIGYWMARSHRGRGLLAEAARAVVEWGFSPERPQIVRIEWRAKTGNVASARVARSLGFRYEGMLRQAFANSLGRDDAWIAGLLRSDDRAPARWAVLED